MNQIVANLLQVKSRITKACINSGRNPGEVQLLLATKTVSAENIKLALQSGGFLIGENKVQELKQKSAFLKDIPHQNHFIGHLQTNKIKDILKYNVSCIQSLDRIELAEKLHQRLIFEQKKMDVFVQVNTSFEESKFGINPKDTLEFVKRVSEFDSLHIKGLMTIGVFDAEAEKVRDCFRLLKNSQQEIISQNIPNVEVNDLSMGMSGDLEAAIEEGSTLVRVGTAVFGQRMYPDSYYWNENRNK